MHAKSRFAHARKLLSLGLTFLLILNFRKKLKKEKAIDKFRRMRSVYLEKGFQLNWNSNTKIFYLWKKDREFFACFDSCWHIFSSFKNKDEFYDVYDVESSIGFLERKIARHLETIKSA